MEQFGAAVYVILSRTKRLTHPHLFAPYKFALSDIQDLRHTMTNVVSVSW